MASTPPAAQTIEAMRKAAGRATAGDLAGALAIVTAALDWGQDEGMLRALAGALACQAGDLPIGIGHLHRALALMPNDVATRANLAQALIGSGDVEPAWALLTRDRAEADRSARLWRLRGHLQQVRGDTDGAIESYSNVVSALPHDAESWNNLGNVQAERGDKSAARAALDRAVKLRPDMLPIRLNHAAAVAEDEGEDKAVTLYESCVRDFPGEAGPLGDLGSLLARLHRDDDALAALERAVALAPSDPDLAVRLGEVCVVTLDTARGEGAFRRALALDPGHADAHLQLAILYEHHNRVENLAALVASAEALAIEPGVLGFIRALTLRRERRFADALTEMLAVPETIEPGRRAQLIGQCHDRLDDAGRAFAAFVEMNRLNSLDPTDPIGRAASLRQSLRQDIVTVTPDWYRSWTASPSAAEDYPAPVFLVGFPRSGTTLLDTLLMGHPAVCVMEELPPLRIVEDMIGGLSRLAALSSQDLKHARARYFEEASTRGGWRQGQLLVDKLPMTMNKVPLVHRLFPGAQFILALRHPCDVVLSCFMATFKLNNAMANFLDLGTTAETYDLSFAYWEQCREVIPIQVHTVRYEDVVADPQLVLKPLFAYLGIDWHEGALDHQKTAAARGSIRTASYSQVTEPIYARAVGRWERYRDVLDPILPMLAPWARRFGYAI